MRKLAVLAALVLAVAAPLTVTHAAPVGDLDLGGVRDFATDLLKEARGATLVDTGAGISGGLYVPVWVFHAKTGAEYLHIGAGVALREGGHEEPLLVTAINLPALSARLWGFQWAQDHVTRLKTPAIWLGPYIKVPFPGRTYVIGREVGSLLSIGLGGGKKGV